MQRRLPPATFTPRSVFLFYIFAATVRFYSAGLVKHIAPALFALSLTGSLAMHSFTSPWLWVSWLALGFGALLLLPWHTGPRPVFFGLLLLLALVWAAIPGSLIWGSGNWILSVGVAIWMAPSLLFYLTSNGHRVFAWLVPTWLFHAGLIIYQSFFTRATIYALDDFGNNIIVRQGGNPTGLSLNSNLAGGFLVLGIIYLLTTRYKWLALPLIFALPMTGSRWAAIVCLAVVVAMTAAGRFTWKELGLGTGVLLVAVSVLSVIYPLSVHLLGGFESLASLTVFSNGEIPGRLAVPHIPSFLPTGIAEHPGLHNVPLRIAVENGILAAVVWVGVTSYALFSGRQPKPWVGNKGNRPIHTVAPVKTPVRGLGGDSTRFDACWWMLLALALLSLLDYYTWMGHLGGFWWLLIGMRVKSNGQTI